MANKVIEVDPFNVGEAIRQLEDFKKDFERKTYKFLNEVVWQIYSLSQTWFDTSLSEMSLSGETSNPEVEVTINKEGDTSVVIARGTEVFFVEFGTGVYFNSSAGSSPHPEGGRLGMVIGGYGKGLGKRKVWGYKADGVKVKTHGIPAQMPMYRAFMRTYENIDKIARRIYG